MVKTAKFRFYEELNDFLPAESKKRWIKYEFMGKPTVKDSVEAIRVPHTEIDLILINGRSVSFDEHISDGDKISVYPVFETFDISEVTRLRPKPLREPRFIVDVQLGRLARYLRMLGFDTLYRNDLKDIEIINISGAENRTVLTRDISLLKHNKVSRGYWVRSQIPKDQIAEVVLKFDLSGQFKALSRCMICNGNIEPVDINEVIDNIPPKVKKYCDGFFRCQSCRKIYWKGTHYDRMKQFIE
ncbi:Mut7-C RNAse domain-containing protein [candidate division KSB1 bacterium]